MKRHLITLLAIIAPLHALAEQTSVSLTNPMVADISQTAIEIHSSFNGTQLLIFGSQNTAGELVIAVRGPTAKVRLRRKERIAGMWMHVDQRKYNDLPLFYALASTEPLGKIASPAMLQSLGLGAERVTLTSNQTTDDVFDPALVRILGLKHWWQVPATKITYFGESLFKARIDLPDTLPRGNYTAEVYLFDRGQLLGFQTIPLLVYKTGMDARIFDLAQKNGALYGLMAVMMALMGGWLAHRLFHRN